MTTKNGIKFKERVFLFFQKNKGVVLALLVLLIYLSPNIFFPSKARFVIHDNLDSNVVWYKNLAESGKMFASNEAIIPNSLGGIPRGCYPGEFNLLHLFYFFFPALFAYNLNIVLMHLIAFFSAYILGKRYFFQQRFQNINILVSLSFALLPFWPSGGLTITGQPLLVYAFLNILYKDFSWKNWLIILAFPFYSLLIFSNLFFGILLFLAFVIYSICIKQINFRFLLALFLFAFVSIVVEYRLFTMQFINHFESHRSGINDFGTLNFRGIIGVSLRHFFGGQYHFYSLQFPFVIFIILISIFIAKQEKQKLFLLGFLLCIYALSILYVLPNWIFIQPFLLKYKLLNLVSLRFYSLAPLMWLLTLSYACYVFLNGNEKTRWLLKTLLSMTILFNFLSLTVVDYFGSRYIENSFYNSYLTEQTPENASFSEYYQISLFNKIKKEIPLGKYYIGCIGIQPEVLQYNGYYTIDGYFFYFPKKYFELMKEINTGEINKSRSAVLYSRCYLLSNDVAQNKPIVKNLDLDFTKIKLLGTRYIFSDRPIVSKFLTYVKRFSETCSKNTVYIYSFR